MKGRKAMKIIKFFKWALIGIGVVAMLFCVAIVSRCDYEDYCREHGQPVETETNPAILLVIAPIGLATFGGAYYLEGKEK